MALVLISLTKAAGGKVDVNPSLIEFTETTEKGTRVVLCSGKELLVVDSQGAIRKTANYRAPDGF